MNFKLEYFSSCTQIVKNVFVNKSWYVMSDHHIVSLPCNSMQHIHTHKHMHIVHTDLHQAWWYWASCLYRDIHSICGIVRIFEFLWVNALILHLASSAGKVSLLRTYAVTAIWISVHPPSCIFMYDSFYTVTIFLLFMKFKIHAEILIGLFLICNIFVLMNHWRHFKGK